MPHHVERDGEGLPIPNRIEAKPVKRTGQIVAAVIVALLAAMLIHGLVTNPRFEWNVVWKYLFNERVLEAYALTDDWLELYGHRVRCEFVGFLRPQIKFDSADDLVAELKRNADETRELTSRAS